MNFFYIFTCPFYIHTEQRRLYPINVMEYNLSLTYIKMCD